jgi:hypothetical protein
MNLSKWYLYIEMRHAGLWEKLMAGYLVTWSLKYKTVLHCREVSTGNRACQSATLARPFDFFAKLSSILKYTCIEKIWLSFFQFWYLSLVEDHIPIMKRKRCWKCFSLRDNEIRAKKKLYTCCIHLELLAWLNAEGGHDRFTHVKTNLNISFPQWDSL